MIGVDQAAASGWGIASERGPVIRWGLAKTHAERIAALRLALSFACDKPEWLFVVFEQHDHMPLGRLGRDDHTTQRAGRAHGVERGTAQIMGMGRAHGRWLELCELLEIHHSHVLEVRPSTWRARIHGVTSGDKIKQAAVDYASREAREDIKDHNVAEGYCITRWASIDGLASFDAERLKAQAERRGDRQLASQGALFGGEPANDNGTSRRRKAKP